MKDEFTKYTFLQLFTDKNKREFYTTEQLNDKNKAIEDREDEDAEANKQFQRKRFDTTQLPLYAIIEPVGDDFKVVATYPLALIRDAEDFAAFLRNNAGP